MGSARFVLAGVVFMASTIQVLAGASSVPTYYTPDPALRTASRDALEARIRRACTVTQARVQNVSEISVSSPCGCYASRTLHAMNESEIQAYRYSGVFNDGARDKALAAIDACRLQRPI
jgi:hypothetical protein